MNQIKILFKKKKKSDSEKETISKAFFDSKFKDPTITILTE